MMFPGSAVAADAEQAPFEGAVVRHKAPDTAVVSGPVANHAAVPLARTTLVTRCPLLIVTACSELAAVTQTWMNHW